MAVPAIGAHNRFRNTVLRSVDWGNPTTADLIACHVPIGGSMVKDLCGRFDLDAFSAIAANDTSTWGSGMSSSGASQQGAARKTGLLGPMSLQPPITLMWVGRFNGEPDANQFFYGCDTAGFGGSSRSYVIRKSSNTGWLALEIYTGSSSVALTVFGISPNFTSPIPRVLIGTIGPSGLALWMNGARIGTDATAVSVIGYSDGFSATDGSFFSVHCRQGTTAGTTNSTFNMGAVWNRQLTDGEIISLSADPFSFLNPR